MDFIFYVLLLFQIIILGSFGNQIDYDFWARLIVGKSFFQTGTLFNNDFYSYGTTHKFIDHEWGSSLIFYLIQDNFGDIGLFSFKILMFFATFFIITKIIRLKKPRIKLHFLFFFFSITPLYNSFSSTVRCQLFSFVFFVLYLYILLYIRKTKNFRILWTLPILNIIWANLHGGFVLGITLIGIFTIGEFLNKNKKYSLYLLITLISTTLTTIINPYGIEYLTFIIDAFKLNRIYISEWQSAFFSKLFAHAYLRFKIFFFATFLIFAYSITKSIKKLGFNEYFRKIDKTKYLIIIFTTLITIKAARCHDFFTYSVMALCYCDFYKIFNKQLPKIIDNSKEIIVLFLISICCLARIYNYKFINALPSKDCPYYAIEFIKKNNLKGNLFTIMQASSYAAYKLYPNNYVFMDGRYEEVYDTNLINEMGGLFLAKNQDEFFKKYHTDILILNKEYPIAQKLETNPNWIYIFEDNKYALYLNKKTFKNKNFKVPTKDKNYYLKTKFDTKINWL